MSDYAKDIIELPLPAFNTYLNELSFKKDSVPDLSHILLALICKEFDDSQANTMLTDDDEAKLKSIIDCIYDGATKEHRLAAGLYLLFGL